jgi:hypothetical protein
MTLNQLGNSINADAETSQPHTRFYARTLSRTNVVSTGTENIVSRGSSLGQALVRFPTRAKL